MGPYTNYVNSPGGGGFVKCLRLFTRGDHGVVYVNIVYIIDIEHRDIETSRHRKLFLRRQNDFRIAKLLNS